LYVAKIASIITKVHVMIKRPMMLRYDEYSKNSSLLFQSHLLAHSWSCENLLLLAC
jgi:hypothetical protein